MLGEVLQGVGRRKPGGPRLSDLGIALLGSHEGDAVERSGPSGKRRSKIVEIVYQPERLGPLSCRGTHWTPAEPRR